jgi:DNA-binding NtrC family response regulator
MMTGHASIEHAVSAIRAGAINYLPKPFEREQLELAVTQGLEFARLRRENRALRDEVHTLSSGRQIVGDSPQLQRAMRTLTTAAPTRATVLLQGESGTGKELFARALHDLSDRRDRAFISLNCAALPEGLIESALFGHEQGAFTGAVKRSLGAFERANGGTLLLDEISELRLDLQAKLLRVLQEQEFERVGGSTPIRVDVRIVATTNRDLAAESEAGRFRRDLYFRLNVVTIKVPALRERSEDIPALVARFAAKTASELGREPPSLAPATEDLLRRYSWPGNVRELQHAVERAVILSTEPVLHPRLFETQFNEVTATGSKSSVSAADTAPRSESGSSIALRSLDLQEAEDVLIQRALAVSGNNRTRAADLLGINVRTLRNKLNKVDADAEPKSKKSADTVS